MYIYTFPLFFLNLFILVNNEKLIFVAIHFRHGSRAPLRLNEKSEDIFGIKWSAPGELTAIGKRMEYLLGLRNRLKYVTGENKFLSDVYDPHELVVFSSNVNRTLQSVTSQLQGLYPISSKKGDVLNPDQFDIAVPPVNISFEEIDKEINSLNDSALPNYMTVIPIHYINFNINNSVECNTKIRDMRINNSNTSKTILNLVEEFNKNFSESLNIYFNKSKDNKFNFTFISSLCDSAVADFTEGKDMTNFFLKTNIDKNIFKDTCYKVLIHYFRDILFLDDNNELVLFFNSVQLKAMINYMKRRIDDDINGEISKKNVSDFSRPKMLIVSGHDTTLTAEEIYFIRFFNIELESYIFPIYTSQITYEITREENLNPGKLKYSDYNVYYYFNDKLIMNITFDYFLEKIEKNMWGVEQIEKFCFGEKTSPPFDTSIVIIIIMGIIILILDLVIIFLVIKIRKNKNISINNGFNDKLVNDNKIINDDEE